MQITPVDTTIAIGANSALIIQNLGTNFLEFETDTLEDTTRPHLYPKQTMRVTSDVILRCPVLSGTIVSITRKA